MIRREREVKERTSSTGGHNRGKFLKKALATREIKVDGEKKEGRDFKLLGFHFPRMERTRSIKIYKETVVDDTQVPSLFLFFFCLDTNFRARKNACPKSFKYWQR